MIRCGQTQIAMIRALALRPRAPGAIGAEPFRGHPRNGLLPAAFRSGVRSVSEKPKHRKYKILFKNTCLVVIPAYAASKLQIDLSNAGRADVAEKLVLQWAGRLLASKGKKK